MVEVLFFVTGLETLQLQGVEMSTGGSIESNARFFVIHPVGNLDFVSVFNLWAQHKKTHFYS
jgi:hypothetical protein